MPGWGVGSGDALFGPEYDGRQRLGDERAQERHPAGLLCGVTVYPSTVVPHFLPVGRVAGLVQRIQPVPSPFQSQRMHRVQPVPEPLFNGGQSGSKSECAGLHPLPGMYGLRRHRAALCLAGQERQVIGLI